jgi:hypothetical protein
MKDNLIIAAMGAGGDKVPYPRPDDTDFWVLNDMIFSRQEGVTMLWNMHLWEHYGQTYMNNALLASKFDIPVMMPRTYDFIKTSIAYPIKEIIEEFNSDYFTTVIPYMIAYAIYKKYKKIDLYGVNMAGPGEIHKNGKACAEYWIGRAQERGVEINCKGKYNQLLKAYDRRLYGYENYFYQKI